MLFFPGWLMTLITFPGVICHEIAHRIFCDLAGVPVHSVSYLGVGKTAGYVENGPIDNLRSAFLISVGPLIVNTALCAILGFAAVVPLLILDAKTTFLTGLTMWISMSIGMHAFPSNTDMQNFIAIVKRSGARGLPYFGGMFLGFAFAIANVLRFFWFDAIYALIVAAVVPWTLFGISPYS